MTRCWFALVDEAPEGASAHARASTLDGEPVGVLAVWLRPGKPLRHARRVDARVVDRAGAPAVVSLVEPPPGVRVLFDDLAVQEARRQVLARPPFDAVTTLLSDSSHFEGSLSVARGPQIDRLVDDPFARVFPARLLRVEGGLFGTVAPATGPTIERYGSAQPWPWDRFPCPRAAPST